MLPTRRPRAVLVSVLALVLTGGVGATLMTGCVGVPTVSTVGTVDFTRPLGIPTLADSNVGVDGVRVFDLQARAGETGFGEGPATPTWGFDQDYLGPTLRASRGERVIVRVSNSLPEATTVHWHGMHVPAAMDGGPHQPIEPGASWSAEWTVDQPAATLWYHPHPHGATEEHVRRGLAGLFLLDDAVERALPLPRDYGTDDIPLIVQDVAFDSDGRLLAREGGFVGALGDQILVNGTLAPYLDVVTDVVRLRVLNASTARTYRFAFADEREFAMIATDGGLLEAPVDLTSVQLSPGERAEILVSMSAGESVVLRSEPPDLGGTIPLLGGSNGGADRFDVLELRAADALASVGTIPESLAPIERLDISTAVGERRFDLDGMQIDQQPMSLGRIDEIVEVGTTELWTVRNGMAFPHNFHIHDVQFQIVDIGGEPPPPEVAGWKDTIYLRPDTDYRLVMRFEDYADPDHPYMYHCHLLRHEDSGMMGQFLVIEPGTAVPATWTTAMMEDDHDH